MARSLLQSIPPLNNRTKRRIVYHMTALAIAGTCSAVIYLFFAKRDFISRLSIATAYGAIALTTLALLLGPWNVIRSQANPVSFDLRRDTGIWAGIFAVLHSVLGLNVHLRGRMWLYFVNEHGRWRTDIFGFGNYTGALAALVFLFLLAISNDASLQRLRPRRWKAWQRFTYVAMVLTFVHGFLYQRIEARAPAYKIVYIAIVACIAGIQLAGIWKAVGPGPREPAATKQ
jgi:sulfoxide reductase heme-binding subunit YedZ